VEAPLLPIFTAFLIALVVSLLLVVAVVLLPRVIRTRAATAHFHCPWAQRAVMLRYLVDERQHPVGVISCTAFADPTIVTCAKLCLAGTGPAGLEATPWTAPAAAGRD
jgi:hypothetical protein